MNAHVTRTTTVSAAEGTVHTLPGDDGKILDALGGHGAWAESRSLTRASDMCAGSRGLPSGKARRKSAVELRVLRANERFEQLLALARDGDETAVSDLWKEFDFNFLKKGGLYE